MLREKHQNLIEQEKNRIREYGHERYKNLSEDKIKMLVEHRKIYFEIQKNKNLL